MSIIDVRKGKIVETIQDKSRGPVEEVRPPFSFSPLLASWPTDLRAVGTR